MATVTSQDRMTLAQALDRLEESQKPTTRDLSSELGSPSRTWDLNTDFNTARLLARDGWREKAGELEHYMTLIQELVERNWTVNWDTSGEAVDTGRFLQGEPECMLNFPVPETRSVRLLVNLSARCTADAPRLLNRGIAIASVVYALQASGIGVSLTAGEWVSGKSGNMHETLMEVNEFSEYIDPARLAFWLGHPATLRRCIFRYNEQQTAEIRREFGFMNSYGGYGYPENPDPEPLRKEGFIFLPFPETSQLDKYDSPQKAFETIRDLLAPQGLNLTRMASGL